MSDGDIILTCFEWFLSFLRLYLISDKDTKGADTRSCIRGVYIGNAFAEDAYVDNNGVELFDIG